MATQAYCAKLLGISERRFRELIGEGVIPSAEKGSYDIELIVPAYCANLREVAAGRGGGEGQANKATAEARLAEAKAEKAEMEAAEMRGTLVPLADIEDPLHSAVQIMKTRLMAIPAKVASQIGAKNPAHAQETIRKHVVEALEGLSKIRVTRIGAA